MNITEQVLRYSIFWKKYQQWFRNNTVLNSQGNIDLAFEKERDKTGELFYYGGRTFSYERSSRDVNRIYDHFPYYSNRRGTPRTSKDMKGLSVGRAICKIELKTTLDK
mgnify:CR=1 FL=1